MMGDLFYKPTIMVRDTEVHNLLVHSKKIILVTFHIIFSEINLVLPLNIHMYIILRVNAHR